jgi:hypothetical protein
MNRRLSVLMCVSWCVTAAAQESAPAAEIPWRRDLDAARAEAARGRLPMLVVFRCEP